MYVVDLLPVPERARYPAVQTHVRQAANDYWNREEFPYELVARMGELGLGVSGSMQQHDLQGADLR